MRKIVLLLAEIIEIEIWADVCVKVQTTCIGVEAKRVWSLEGRRLPAPTWCHQTPPEARPQGLKLCQAPFH